MEIAICIGLLAVIGFIAVMSTTEATCPVCDEIMDDGSYCSQCDLSFKRK